MIFRICEKSLSACSHWDMKIVHSGSGKSHEALTGERRAWKSLSGESPFRAGSFHSLVGRGRRGYAKSGVSQYEKEAMLRSFFR